MSLIAVIGQDEATAAYIKEYLEMNDFSLECYPTGDTGLAAVLKKAVDLVILDPHMKGTDGYEVIRRIREEKEIPIIAVSAGGEEIDVIRAFRSGADDYITAPLRPGELTARVRGHLDCYERLLKVKESHENRIEIRDLLIEKGERRTFLKGREILLTNKEFDMICFLASHPNIVYSKEELYKEIWGMDAFGDIATVTVHVKKLREKLEENIQRPEYIETVWGVGYRLRR